LKKWNFIANFLNTIAGVALFFGGAINNATVCMIVAGALFTGGCFIKLFLQGGVH